jgi:Helicase HerA, central domain
MNTSIIRLAQATKTGQFQPNLTTDSPLVSNELSNPLSGGFDNSFGSGTPSNNIAVQGTNLGGGDLDILPSLSGFLNFLLWSGVWITVVFFLIHGIRLLKYFWMYRAKTYRLKFLEISLPKITSEENEKESGRKQDQEIIAASEAIYQVLNHYSRDYYISDWFNGVDSFSFEIAKHKGKVKFLIGCPESVVDTIEKQIVSTFHRCRITVQEHIDWGEGKKGHVAELYQKKELELPFKTYTQVQGTDLMNNLINALEVAKETDTMVFQMVLSPVGNWWQDKGRKKAHKMQNEKDKNVLAKKSGAYAKEFGDKDDDDKMGGYLTPNQQNIVKRLEEKASKPGFRVAMRVAAFSDTRDNAKSLIKSFIPALKVFDVQPFNALGERKFFKKYLFKDFFRLFWYFQESDFAVRRPAIDNTAIINVEEANSLWHLPNHLIQSPSIDWMSSYKPALPVTLITDPNYGILIGEADGGYNKKMVYQSKEDRTRHSYILGGSGSGKSVFMNNLIMEDIKAGYGVCVVDPHGETVDEVLMRIPPERINDVAIISPSFLDYPNGLNVLYTDPRHPEHKTLVVNNLFEIWDKLYDMKTAGGPQFEVYMKNAARLVMGHPESGNTLLEIGRIFEDPKFRQFKISMSQDEEVNNFWTKQANQATGEQSLANMTTYITSKLSPFTTNDFLRTMIGQCENTIDIRRFMDNRKIILVKLEKGTIGEMSMFLLGMIIVSNIVLAGMGRSDGLKYNMDGSVEKISSQDRPPFFVYIDEMQNFLFKSLPAALEEIRKYKVGFTLAHQFVKQVVEKGEERIKDSIMANTGSKFIFNCGLEDAEMLEKEFKPTLTARDLMNPERYTCNARIMLNGQKTTPFNLRVANLSPDTNKEMYSFIVQQSKLLYGTAVEDVENDIKNRIQVGF